jgi:hypothetical protein
VSTDTLGVTTWVAERVYAARVYEACKDVVTDPAKVYAELVAIHAAPRWLWPALVEKMVADGMTAEATRKAVAEVKDAPIQPAWKLRTPWTECRLNNQSGWPGNLMSGFLPSLTVRAML